jgi:hypothetical protein
MRKKEKNRKKNEKEKKRERKIRRGEEGTHRRRASTAIVSNCYP